MVNVNVKLITMDLPVQIVYFILDIFVKILKTKIYSLSDLGCNSGGSLNCSNGGACLANGMCGCKFGYSGAMCSTCELNIILLLKYRVWMKA